MYLRRFVVENVRSISNIQMDFAKGTEAGWHVILGSNGAGKSSLVRAFALAVMGEKEAYAARQDFSRWIREGQSTATIEAQIVMDPSCDFMKMRGAQRQRPISIVASLESDEPGHPEVKFTGQGHARTIWSGGKGWFAASFGPFRRFTGGDNKYDRLFVSNKRLAPHLTALGEDVALTDAMSWLTTLFSQTLQEHNKGNHKNKTLVMLEGLLAFLNESNFLPHGAKVSDVTIETVIVKDGNGIDVALDQLSDGYRSALSLVLELVRQMFELYDYDLMMDFLTMTPGTIQAPGVVVIDEVDAHLHPTWQRDIGRWLTKCFPNVQFIVTTHSPIVCRAVASDEGELRGSIWKLPSPGSNECFRAVDEIELNRLVYGDVLDAYSTDLFGEKVIRSKAGIHKLDRLAELNVKSLDEKLSTAEEAERRVLRKAFPGNAGILSE